jgi:predicted DNA-binding transcriptional regulator AlpA
VCCGCHAIAPLLVLLAEQPARFGAFLFAASIQLGGFLFFFGSNDKMSNPDFDQLRSRSEFARMLGVSVDTVKAMEKRGEAPPRIQVSPKIVAYRESDIQEFLNSRTIAVA